MNSVVFFVLRVENVIHENIDARKQFKDSNMAKQCHFWE